MGFGLKTYCLPAIFVGFVLLLVPSDVLCDTCFPKSLCYCRIDAVEGRILIRAEVVSSDESVASLQVLGEPYHDPDGSLADGQIVHGLDCMTMWDTHSQYCDDFHIGRIGVFLIAPDDSRILTLVWESNGLLICDFDSNFAGVPTDEMIEIVLGGDCWNTVKEWDIKIDCDDNSGCSTSGTPTGSGNSIFSIMLAVIAFFACHTICRSRGNSVK
jgi:hypothetical protein